MKPTKVRSARWARRHLITRVFLDGLWGGADPGVRRAQSLPSPTRTRRVPRAARTLPSRRDQPWFSVAQANLIAGLILRPPVWAFNRIDQLVRESLAECAVVQRLVAASLTKAKE